MFFPEDFFNVDYRTILNNLDTGTFTLKGEKFIYLFSLAKGAGVIQFTLAPTWDRAGGKRIVY